MPETSSNIRLGIFVATGTALLVAALYLIGSRQDLFGDTFEVSARFYTVNGLMKGNNVRFAGIDVGTVKEITIVNDSSVLVTMVIEKDTRRFIKKNAIASVGTDGLMGNKLVNINAGDGIAGSVQEGDELRTLRPVDTDEMVRTLNVTNENIKVISSNLRNITDRINSKNSMWSLLMDTIVADNIKTSVTNLKLMSKAGTGLADDLHGITQLVRTGKGTVGALIADSSLSVRLKSSVNKLEKFGDTASAIATEVSGIVLKLKGGEGSLGMLLKDTALAHGLNSSISAIDRGANGFDANMEALKHTWPLKRYFRKMEKSKQK